jgi:ribosomal protein L11 methyltransferase
MWSILIPAHPENQEALIAALWEQGTTGIIEEPSGLRAFFDDATDPVQLEFLKGEFRRESDHPQAPFAREDWDPILIGQRFFIAPPWVTVAAPPGRFRLNIDAAMAFGTGRHETTQLCIEALEKHLQPGALVLDIGCGSGILSAAARLLNAGPIFSCDIHEDALQAARHHVQSPLFLGSADAIRPTVGDLVLANISARIVDHIAADLKRILAPSGLVILSGFIAENPPKHFRPIEETVQGDWLCWLCRRDDIHPTSAESDPNLHSQEWWL